MARRPEGLFMLAALAASSPALAGPLDAITQKDAAGGLKAALTQGIGNAVGSLGKPDGFLGNPKVKIPLQPRVATAEEMLRMLCMGKQADELITSMNRAAESAVPEAKALLVDSVKQMTLQDAKSILTGGDDSATEERAIRKDPLGQSSTLVQKVFGAIR